MIPFVAAGGLLMALSFIPFLGGVDVNEDGQAFKVIVDNALWNLPPGGLGQYLGSVMLRHRSHVDELPGTRPRRLHRLRHCRQAWNRARIRGGCRRGPDELRLHRRNRRWSDGRFRSPLVRPARRAALAPRAHARGDHPAGRFHRRIRHPDPVPRSSDRLADGMAEHLVERSRCHRGDRRRGRDPRPDDVLRPRWPDQQGRLCVRGRGTRNSLSRESDAVPHHGCCDVCRHGAAARDGSCIHGPRPRSVPAGRARERQGGLAARCRVHQRGGDPVRRGRSAARHPRIHGRRRGHRWTVHAVRRRSHWHRTAASSYSSRSIPSGASSSRSRPVPS